MIIKGKRKHKLDKRLLLLTPGSKIVVSVIVSEAMTETLSKVGFTESLSLGETVLPNSSIGPACRYNANGKEIKLKDLPMETVYRQKEWHWKQWAGRGMTENKSKIVDVPYPRYQRSFDPPPSIELSISRLKIGSKCIIAPTQEIDKDDPKKLLHTINVFLEIFGYCEILSENLDGYVINKLKRLNWTVLPPGKWPWKKLKKEVDPLIDQIKKQNQIVVRYRLQVISHFEPEFVAIGRAGFSGYLIFGFPQKDLFVLESAYTENATYVFDKNWEELSKLSKAEILSEQLQKDRLVHRKNWKNHIYKLLK
jgi:hypothetical protein